MNLFLTVLLAVTLLWFQAPCVQAAKEIKVAILPLQSELVPELDYLDKAIEEMLTSRLAFLGVKTVDPLQVKDAMDKMEPEFSELAKELGADYLVTGILSGTKDRLRITLRLIGPAHHGKPVEVNSRPIEERQILPEVQSLAARLKLLMETPTASPKDAESPIPAKPAAEPRSAKTHPDLLVPQGPPEPQPDEQETPEAALKTTEEGIEESEEDYYFVPDYPVPVDEGPERASTSRPSKAGDHKAYSPAERDDADFALPDLPPEEDDHAPLAVEMHREQTAPAQTAQGEEGRFSWLIPWSSGHAEKGQGLAPVSPQLPYPPPEPLAEEADKEESISTEAETALKIEPASEAHIQERGGWFSWVKWPWGGSSPGEEVGQEATPEADESTEAAPPVKGPLWQWY